MTRSTRELLLTFGWIALIVSAVSGDAIPAGAHVTMFGAAVAVIALGFFAAPPAREDVVALLGRAWPLAAFFAIMVVTAAAGEVSSEAINGLGKHLTPIVLTVAAALTLSRLTLRWWIIVTLLAVGITELAVTIAQATQHGFDIAAVDLVTGTFGEFKSAYVSVFVVGAAVLAMAMAMELPRRNQLYWILAAALPIAGVLAAGRGVVFLAPAAAAGLLLADLASRCPFAGKRRTGLVMVSALALLPILGLVLEVTYPGATEPLRSPARVAEYLGEDERDGAGLRLGAQLTKSIDLVGEQGVGESILGTGVGTSEPGTAAGAEPIFTDGDVIRSRSEFNGTFAPRLIVESGFLGLLGWLGIVAWSFWLGERARWTIQRGGLNAVIVRAMPGLAALMLFGSFYSAGPAAPPLELVFWVPLGICLRFVALGERNIEHQSSRASSV